MLLGVPAFDNSEMGPKSSFQIKIECEELRSIGLRGSSGVWSRRLGVKTRWTMDHELPPICSLGCAFRLCHLQCFLLLCL